MMSRIMCSSFVQRCRRPSVVCNGTRSPTRQRGSIRRRANEGGEDYVEGTWVRRPLAGASGYGVQCATTSATVARRASEGAFNKRESIQQAREHFKKQGSI